MKLYKLRTLAIQSFMDWLMFAKGDDIVEFLYYSCYSNLGNIDSDTVANIIKQLDEIEKP